MFQPVGRLMRVPFEFWRHPQAVTRRWLTRRRWPTPSKFDQMDPAAIDAYLRSVGLDTRIQAALATAEGDTD